MQQLLLSHLYQKLIRYTDDLRLRRALSLDPLAQRGEQNARPLSDTLSSDDDRNPLDALIEQEAARKREPDAHHSPASAYMHLVRRFDNRMPKLAEYLLISLSHAYRCYARAKCPALHQLPAPMLVANTDFLTGPWRRFRLQREPVQLTFTFDEGFPS